MQSSESTPASANLFAFSNDVRVQFEPAFAMRGIRPLHTSTLRFTISKSSSAVKVGDSLVVPRTRIASVPFSIWNSSSSSSLSRLMLPSSLKGVISATIDPLTSNLPAILLPSFLVVYCNVQYLYPGFKCLFRLQVGNKVGNCLLN